MGGYGSGRWSSNNKKEIVEHSRPIDASSLTRRGILGPGLFRSGGLQWVNVSSGQAQSSIGYEVSTDWNAGTLRLRYTFTESGDSMDYSIELQTTRPQYGGIRWWFTCPVARGGGETCGRRVQKLYLPSGRRYYGCRHCYDLSYAGRNGSALDRSREKARGIRLRLGGSPSLVDPFPPKPRGMWWRTYERLRDRYEHADTRATLLLQDWMTRLRCLK